MARTQDRIQTLDAVRGVCAIAVAFMHCKFLTGLELAPSAYLGVDMFFLMSGFVVGAAYDRRLTNGGFVGAFFWRRVARLWPMWALGMTIGAALELTHAHRTGYLAWAARYGCGLLLVPLPGRAYLFPVNTPGWSLMCEALANAAYALTARFLRPAVLGSVVVVAALGLVIAAQAHGSLSGGYEPGSVLVGLTRVAFGFFLGLLVFKLPRPRPLAGPVPFLVALGIITAAFFAVPAPRFRVAFDLAFVLAGCPLLLLISLATPLVGASWAERLGALSYPLYAVHSVVLLLMLAVRGAAFGWTAQPMSVPAAVVVLAVLVSFSLWLGVKVEPATQRLLGRLLHQRPVRVPSPADA